MNLLNYFSVTCPCDITEGVVTSQACMTMCIVSITDWFRSPASSSYSPYSTYSLGGPGSGQMVSHC